MKKIILFVIASFLFMGCATTGDRYQVLQQTGLFYEANNEDCPNIEIKPDKSLQCYSKDMKKLHILTPVSEDYVRAYRAQRDADRLQKQKAHEAQTAFRRINTNPLLGHL